MRNTLLLLTLLFLFPLLSFQSNSTRTATVEPVSGLYIYWHSRPTDDYKYIDSYTIQVAWSGKPEELINTLINKVKKKWPEANGIIITDDGLAKCDVIQLK